MLRLLALSLLAICSCFAQDAELSIHGGYTALTNTKLGNFASVQGGLPDSFADLKSGFRFGFRLTLNSLRFFGHEVGYGYNRTQLRYNIDPPVQQGFAAHQGFYDFIAYATPQGFPVRPFLAGGAQFTNFTPPGQSATQGGGSTKFGVNYGGGIKVRVSSLFIVRADVRQYLSPKPFDFLNKSGALRQNELSVGFGIAF
jgi:hypothetical protein